MNLNTRLDDIEIDKFIILYFKKGEPKIAKRYKRHSYMINFLCRDQSPISLKTMNYKDFIISSGFIGWMYLPEIEHQLSAKFVDKTGEILFHKGTETELINWISCLLDNRHSGIIHINDTEISTLNIYKHGVGRYLNEILTKCIIADNENCKLEIF